MNGILDNLAKGIANAVAPNDPDVKILNAQSEIDRLKNEEIKIFAEIGKKAIEEEGAEKYGEFSEKLTLKQDEIKKAEENLTTLKAEKEAAEKAKAEREAAEEAANSSRFCTSCGTENGPGVKFCMECGTKLETEAPKKLFCTNCGAENKPGTKFCTSCGSKIGM